MNCSNRNMVEKVKMSFNQIIFVGQFVFLFDFLTLSIVFFSDWRKPFFTSLNWKLSATNVRKSHHIELFLLWILLCLCYSFAVSLLFIDFLALEYVEFHHKTKLNWLSTSWWFTKRNFTRNCVIQKLNSTIFRSNHTIFSSNFVLSEMNFIRRFTKWKRNDKKNQLKFAIIGTRSNFSFPRLKLSTQFDMCQMQFSLWLSFLCIIFG